MFIVLYYSISMFHVFCDLLFVEILHLAFELFLNNVILTTVWLSIFSILSIHERWFSVIRLLVRLVFLSTF